MMDIISIQKQIYYQKKKQNRRLAQRGAQIASLALAGFGDIKAVTFFHQGHNGKGYTAPVL